MRIIKNRKGIYTFCQNFIAQSYKNGHIVLLVALFFLASCGSGSNEQAQDSKTDVIEEGGGAEGVSSENMGVGGLQEEIDMLTDSISSLKNQAFVSEQTKLENALLLVEEVQSSLQKFDAAQLQNLKSLQSNAQEAMYDSVTLGSESVMLAYDNATEQLIQSWQEFVANNEEFNQHARAKLLYNEMMQADNADFEIRKNYNEYVSRYNAIVENNADELNQMGGKYADLAPLPLFYGGPAM